MAKSLANFVVGIGADVGGFKDGMKEVNSGLNGLRTSALTAGGILTTALTAVAGIAVSTASDIRDLDLQLQFTDVGIQRAYDYGNAVARMGGDAQTARDSIVGMQKALNAFQREGESGKLEAVAILGVDPSGLFNLQNDLNAFQSNLADIISTATSKQKLGLQDIFGLSDAEMRLLEKGSIGLDVELRSSMTRTGEIESMVEASRELTNEWGILKEHAKGFSNTISKEALPAVQSMLKSANVGLGATNIAKEKGYTTAQSSQIGIMMGTMNMMKGWFEKPKEKPEKIETEEQTRRRNEWENRLDAPTIDGAERPQIIIERDVPTATPVKSNVQSSTSTQSFSRPIEVHANITTSVELDKRKIGEAVTEYQEEQFFIDAEGFKTTTVS